jgi:2-methylcitrate dehydratase PrpD
MIAKVEVIHDKELDKYQPQSVPCRLEVRLRSGERITSSVDHPLGHIRNPAGDKDIERKVAGLTAGLMTKRRVSKLIKLCRQLDEIEDVSALVSTLRVTHA